MTAFYETYPRFLVSVDCIIFGFAEGKLKLLIQERPYEPEKGMLSLIGGFVKNDESVDTAAQRVLTQFTGLKDLYMRQLRAFGEVERDKGERVISVAYYALINVGDYNSNQTDSHGAHWTEFNELPELCFDHNQMVEEALKELQKSVFEKDICNNLLPELFTLSKLQTLHEAILGSPVDKRNFRRSILDRNYIIKTDKIDKTSSRRGASLYKFKD